MSSSRPRWGGLVALFGAPVLVDEQPGVAAGTGQRRVAPAGGQVVRGCDHGRRLDGGVLHPVPGEGVGVLEVFRALSVAYAADALAVEVAHCAAHPVVDVKHAVVAAEDDAVADGELQAGRCSCSAPSARRSPGRAGASPLSGG